MREETKNPAQTGKYFAQSGRTATKDFFCRFPKLRFNILEVAPPCFFEK